MILYYASKNEYYRKGGIVNLEKYDETLRTMVYYYHNPTPSYRKEIYSHHELRWEFFLIFSLWDKLTEKNIKRFIFLEYNLRI